MIENYEYTDDQLFNSRVTPIEIEDESPVYPPQPRRPEHRVLETIEYMGETIRRVEDRYSDVPYRWQAMYATLEQAQAHILDELGRQYTQLDRGHEAVIAAFQKAAAAEGIGTSPDIDYGISKSLELGNGRYALQFSWVAAHFSISILKSRNFIMLDGALSPHAGGLIAVWDNGKLHGFYPDTPEQREIVHVHCLETMFLRYRHHDSVVQGGSTGKNYFPLVKPGSKRELGWELYGDNLTPVAYLDK